MRASPMRLRSARRRGSGGARGVVGVVLLSAFAVLLAACGGDSETDGVGGGDGSEISDVTVTASGAPEPGGKVTMAIEAETDGFNPTSNRWAISGFMVASAVFDPLAVYDEDGQVRPYLAESFTSSGDFRTWVITVRPDVRFHNGEPLDGAAVRTHLDLVRSSPLTGASLATIDDIAVDPADPLSVLVRMKEPWASFPATLVGQVGYIAAPAQLAADATASSRQPIGTGPFVHADWVPDRSWRGTKNPDYWRTDADGTRLPYLDEVEFVPVPDNQNRVNALLAGDVQLLHATNWPAIHQLRSQATSGAIQLVTDTGESEESFVMFNTAVAPVDDPRVRRAAALCTDREQVFEVSQTPPEYAATSQYASDSPWFNADAGFPTLDPDEVTRLIEEVEADTGPVRFTLATTPVPENRAVIEVLRQQWEACGMDVELLELEQSRFISDAVVGNFQANLWRQFASRDPDGDYVWWTGRNAAPIGQLALNVARLQEDRIDAALDRARSTDDVEVRKEAYAEVQARQSELVPYVWLAQTEWAIGAAVDVQGIGNQTLPDGEPSSRFQVGFFRLTETWLDR